MAVVDRLEDLYEDRPDLFLVHVLMLRLALLNVAGEVSGPAKLHYDVNERTGLVLIAVHIANDGRVIQFS